MKVVYAATSAVHLLVLISTFSFNSDWNSNVNSAQQFGDIDIIRILTNLTASAIMLTPILLWSTTIRKYDAQPIVILWGGLIFSALVCLLYKEDYELESWTPSPSVQMIAY
jgi:hypothetical protein